MTDLHRVLQTPGSISAHLRRFGGGARRPDGVMKRLGRHHRASETVVSKRHLNAFDNVPLLILAERVRGNHVGVVRRPVADPDFGVIADYGLKSDRFPCRSMEQRLSLVSSRPLRARDIVLTARVRSVSAATRLREPLD